MISYIARDKMKWRYSNLRSLCCKANCRALRS